MINPKQVRIGTRNSALALYQARAVERQLNQLGIETQIVEVSSEGDLDLVTPLYEMGIQGIFTKSLDSALLQSTIDIAVHSAKDIPTKLAKGLTLNAVLERASHYDCLVLPKDQGSLDGVQDCIIATSSLRRKSQWLYKHPHHRIENLRGNIQTRLKKLDQSTWQGAIFAQAAIERMEISSHHYITLDWMLPSPAQGAIAIVCCKDDNQAIEICTNINHHQTNLCITAERDFLATLHGGCSVPIAAHAEIQQDQLFFRGNIFSLDSKHKCEVELSFDLGQATVAGTLAAQEILRLGGEDIIKTFRPAF
ncbi:MAG: hydroxymethylbilane synthase [Bacteroidia bacterium]|nr:hydroxymethylbilane synthase [Bacteroidia bacterium]